MLLDLFFLVMRRRCNKMTQKNEKPIKYYSKYMVAPELIKLLCNHTDKQLAEDLKHELNKIDNYILEKKHGKIKIVDNSIVLEVENSLSYLIPDLRAYEHATVLVPKQVLKDCLLVLETYHGVHVTDVEGNIRDKGLSWIFDESDLCEQLESYLCFS